MKKLNEVHKLQNEGKLEEALRILQNLVLEEPDSAIINYEFGSNLDMSDRSEEAIPYYQKALKLGLSEKFEQECMLGLGSSLSWRNLHKESIEVLQAATKKYPHNLALQLFYGISLHRSEFYEKSSKLFLEIISECEDKEILKFKRAIKNYLKEM